MGVIGWGVSPRHPIQPMVQRTHDTVGSLAFGRQRSAVIVLPLAIIGNII